MSLRYIQQRISHPSVRRLITLLFLLLILQQPSFAAAGSSTPNSMATVGGTVPSNVICTIYNIYRDVSTIVYVVGLILIVLGAALYASSHMMPGSSKNTLQSYGLGMVMGGIIGIIIATAAPYAVQLITGQNLAQLTNISQIATC